VFLSTDAGGTGLNLQTADTVVNLELPWNPAVLEQRIARVHRMGQSRPVRVINFVTRGTIEEKVLRTLEAKQALFAGLFAGDADEIPFEAINTGGFLDTMRELVGSESGGRGEGIGERKESSGHPAQAIGEHGPLALRSSLIPTPSPLSPATLWHGLAQIVEGVCAVLGAPGAAEQIPPEARERLVSAVRALATQIRPGSEN
jgi:superfamily II DNA/RNA helicase